MFNQEVKRNMIVGAIIGAVAGLGVFAMVKAILTYQSTEYDACVAYQERFIKSEYPDAKNDILRYKIDRRVKEFCSLN